MISEDSANGERIIKKILVAMDSSRHSEAALQAAVSLAKMMEATIQGLFVQDARWQQISRLPSVAEVNMLTGDIEPLGADKLEQQIRCLEERIHHRFEQLTRHHQLSHSWKSMEGKVADKLLEACVEADLITIGMKGEFFTGRKRLGSTTKAVIEKSPKPVLILQEGLKLGQTIIAVDNGTELGRKGIRHALSLAEKNESKLLVLKIDQKPRNVQWQKQVGNMLKNSPSRAEAHLLNELNYEKLLNLVNRQHGGLLVIPKNEHFAETAAIEKLLYNLDNPILLVI